MSKGKFYFSKSLEKGLKILSLFNRETPSLIQSDIAKALSLNTTSTYRYINTLVEMGFLEKDEKTKAIRPSVQCLVFCTNLLRATDHGRLIKGVIDPIHKEHNISIEVAFAVDDTLVRFYNKEAAETLTYSLPDSSKNCLHNTALGKAYLCSLPEDQRKAKLDGMNLTPKTEKTIRDRKSLMADLRVAKSRGYAVSEEEFLPGLIAIGAPLVDPLSGRGVGAVSFDFSVLQNTVEDIQARYSGLIVATAKKLSGLLPPDRHGR
ncbi:MAG: IclR family transcriptional regulator [Desulfobacterales bacterium]|jgi:DNA-binding IclR family transcriptional regulator